MEACTVYYPFGRYSDYEDRPSGCDDDYIWHNYDIMLDTMSVIGLLDLG